MEHFRRPEGWRGKGRDDGNGLNYEGYIKIDRLIKFFIWRS